MSELWEQRAPGGADFCPTCGSEMRPRRSRVWPIVIGGIVALAGGVGIALAVSNNGGAKTSTVTAPVTSTVTTSHTTSVNVQTPTQTVTAPSRTATVTVPAQPVGVEAGRPAEPA